MRATPHVPYTQRKLTYDATAPDPLVSIAPSFSRMLVCGIVSLLRGGNGWNPFPSFTYAWLWRLSPVRYPPGSARAGSGGLTCVRSPSMVL